MLDVFSTTEYSPHSHRTQITRREPAIKINALLPASRTKLVSYLIFSAIFAFLIASEYFITAASSTERLAYQLGIAAFVTLAALLIAGDHLLRRFRTTRILQPNVSMKPTNETRKESTPIVEVGVIFIASGIVVMPAFSLFSGLGGFFLLFLAITPAYFALSFGWKRVLNRVILPRRFAYDLGWAACIIMMPLSILLATLRVSGVEVAFNYYMGLIGGVAYAVQFLSTPISLLLLVPSLIVETRGINAVPRLARVALAIILTIHLVSQTHQVLDRGLLRKAESEWQMAFLAALSLLLICSAVIRKRTFGSRATDNNDQQASMAPIPITEEAQ